MKILYIHFSLAVYGGIERVLAEEHSTDWKCHVPIFVIYNSFSFYPKEVSHRSNRKVIMVGRYNDAKGYGILIPALDIVHQRHSDWEWNVYGSSESRDQEIEWIHGNHLDNSIIMHNPVDNIIEKYIDNSICVLSLLCEGFSLVIMEAMSCGVPVVSFDCPHGPRNIIKNEEDGILIEPLNYQALANGICMLKENEGSRMQLGANVPKNVLRFSQESMMEQWDNLFKLMEV